MRAHLALGNSTAALQELQQIREDGAKLNANATASLLQVRHNARQREHDALLPSVAHDHTGSEVGSGERALARVTLSSRPAV